MSRLVSLAVLVAVIVLVGALFYKVMVGFLVPVFLAAVLVVVFRPMHRWVLNQSGNREHVAAGLTTFLVLLCVLFPAGFVLTTAAIQGTSLVGDVNETSVKLFLDRLRSKVGLQYPHAGEIKKVKKDVTEIQSAAATFSDVEDAKTKLETPVKRVRAELAELRSRVLKDNENSSFVDSFDAMNKSLALLEPPFEASLAEPSVDPLAPISEPDSSATPRQIDITELQERVVDFGRKWRTLRETLLGGTTTAFLIEISNPTDQEIRDLFKGAFEYIQPKLLSFGGATGAFVLRLVIGSAVLIVSLYFFLYDGPSMVRAIMQLSPMDNRYEQQLLMEFDRISRAIVLATILSAIVQGLTAGIGYYVVGMPSLVFLVLLTTMCALIPFVGPALVWVPVCLYLGIYEDRLIPAILLAVWGLLVVATVDNVVKMFVLHGQSQLHPLLALLSVLGGVQALGPVGIVVGPMAVVLLQTLLGILQHELDRLDNEPIPLAEGSAKPIRGFVRRFKPRGKKSGGKGESDESASITNDASELPAEKLPAEKLHGPVVPPPTEQGSV
jgi:predicted PurR-regulated permease PerM